MIIEAFLFLPPVSCKRRLTSRLTRKVNQEVNQKPMKTSVSVVCYKYKVLANGESPLMLHIF